MIYLNIMNNFKEQEKVKQHILFFLTGPKVLTIETCPQIFASIDEKNNIECLIYLEKKKKDIVQMKNFYKKMKMKICNF